jgi:hypothetical protein
MPRPSLRRTLALIALALALFAVLPCASLAAEDSCCSASASCADSDASPCAQLAATPCCAAPQVPLDRSFSPALPDAPPNLEVIYPVCVGDRPAPRRRPAPPALTDHATIRDVLLRL